MAARYEEDERRSSIPVASRPPIRPRPEESFNRKYEARDRDVQLKNYSALLAFAAFLAEADRLAGVLFLAADLV